MFGAGLPEAWPFAASAAEDLPGFIERLKTAVAASEQVFKALETRGIRVRRMPGGTNVAFLPLGPRDPAEVQTTLAAAHVRVGMPPRGAKELRVAVNESWNCRAPRELAEVLAQALGRT